MTRWLYWSQLPYQHRYRGRGYQSGFGSDDRDVANGGYIVPQIHDLKGQASFEARASVAIT